MSWLEEKNKKREKSKKHHEYNSYKFEGAKSQGLGKYNNGVLSFSKTQIRKITGGEKKGEHQGFNKKGFKKGGGKKGGSQKGGGKKGGFKGKR